MRGLRMLKYFIIACVFLGLFAIFAIAALLYESKLYTVIAIVSYIIPWIMFVKIARVRI